jgi:hypothetical protein
MSTSPPVPISPASTSERWPGLRRSLPYLALLLPFLLILPGLFAFPYPLNGESDLAVSHYPNAVFLLDALRRWGEVPLWSPSILSGYPFFADPLAGLWYPPGWLALLFPLPFGFNLLVALHLAWGGLGMVWLLRREGLSQTAALFGGVAFACLPKLYAHFGAGHLTLLYAVPWTPWLLWAGLRSRAPFKRSAGGRPAWRAAALEAWRSLLPGLVLALIFLADVRWAAYAGLLWWAHALSHSQFNLFSKAFPRVLVCLIGQTAFALVLSAPQALPLLEYTRLSTRAWMLPSDILVYSLPPARLVWLIFPDFGGFHEFMLYPGAVVLALAVAAIANRAAKAGRLFWGAVFLVSLLFSLGEHLPGLGRLVGLPGLDLLRVPSRALFITGMALAALAAYGLDSLLTAQPVASRKRMTLSLAALSALALSLLVGINLATGLLLPNLAWGAAAILAACLLVGFMLRDWPGGRKWLLALLFLAAIDWSLIDRLVYDPRPVDQVLAQGAGAAEFLASLPGRFRVYSPSYSLPQQTGARYRLEQADGVDPLQLAAYAGFMQAATGVPRQGYSVTVPPFASGSPKVDNIGYIPQADLLGLLGVRYVLSEFDLQSEQLRMVRRFGETRLYENPLARPLAWVQPEDSPIGEDLRPVIGEAWQPNQIVVKAAGPGLLVLSEMAYPGWRAWLDGAEVPVEMAGGLLWAVRLGPGEHTVVFRLEPNSLYRGLAILFLGNISFLGGLIFYLIRKYHSGR